MSNTEFRAFMDLLMCSDPWPVPDTGERDGEAVLLRLADSEAHRRGYATWTIAFHEWRPSWPDDPTEEPCE